MLLNQDFATKIMLLLFLGKFSQITSSVIFSSNFWLVFLILLVYVNFFFENKGAFEMLDWLYLMQSAEVIKLCNFLMLRKDIVQNVGVLLVNF